MIKYLFLFIIFFSITPTFSQKFKADSLKSLLAKETIDSNKVNLMWRMAEKINTYNPDSALITAQKALTLSRKIKYEEGESRSLAILANSFNVTGNYPRALETYLEKLQLDEKRDKPRNLASALLNIGTVYVYQEEYRKALPYYFKADSVIEANKIEDLFFYSNQNLGDLYDRLNIFDSAFTFYNKAIYFATKQQDGDFIGTSMSGLGHIFLKQGDYENALVNYTGALPYLHAANDDDMICDATLGLAKLYEKINKNDSAIYYAHNSFSLAKMDGFQSRELDAAVFLADHFKKIKDIDSAFLYTDKMLVLKDSISSKERIRESQRISSNEQLRQLEIEESIQKAKEERSQQLQLLFIGIFIPGIFLLTLLLNRIKIHYRFIKVLGILSLLMLFEYLTLLLHPFVAQFTHHTPVYEMLIFVSIAAILIPSHHRIEHWLIEKLTGNHQSHPNADSKIKTKSIKIKKPSD